MIEKRSPQPSLADRVLALVASGQATSRTELTHHLGAAASSISTTVQRLLERGLIAEDGVESSAGGRPRKVLRLGSPDEYALAADVGRHHARIGLVRAGGRTEQVSTIPFDISVGPEAGIDLILSALEPLAATASGMLGAVGVSLPGPVDITLGGVDRPSSMPGWNGFPVRDAVADRLNVPVTVENDANLMAIGEDAARRLDHRQSITVKAGTAIGAGIIIGGQLYRGATGAAGDITHVRIDAADDIPCSCGNVGCLETVASGAGLVRILREQGLPVTDTEDVVRLAREARPLVVTAVRRAGGYLGEVLSANVNFFNPDAVYLGGILSTLEPFVAAVRSRLYDYCHPLVTQHLTIERTSLGADAGLVGAGVYALQNALAGALDQARTSLPIPTRA